MTTSGDMVHRGCGVEGTNAKGIKVENVGCVEL